MSASETGVGEDAGAGADAAARAALLSQRQAADPEASVWVAANAGAGKTRVLVDRVLRLLLAGTRPEAVLCLTFTKAAAAEMANRLYRELGAWAIADDGGLSQRLRALSGREPEASSLPAARQLFARLLDVPGGLRIQTIHAFCQSLLARFPLEAGIAPHFQVMDERSAAELLAAAEAKVLAAAAKGRNAPLAAALDHLVGLVDESAFSALMRELAAARGRLQALLRAHGGEVERVIAATAAALGLQSGEDEARILAAGIADGAFDRPGLARAATVLAEGGKTDQKNADAIAAFLAAGDDRPALFVKYYRPVFLTQTDEPKAERSLASKASQAGDGGLLDILQREQSRLVALDQRLKAARVLAATTALWRLGAALLESYRRAKNAAALLDYDDLILGTRDLLTRTDAAPWVLYKLDGGIDHILVDEAQDTAPEQWEVIAALAAEFFAGAGAVGKRRTLFAVGDEKQSIYSFQGADPAEFARMRTHFAARVQAAGETFRGVELALSFRSTTAVLAAVDAVFAEGPAAAGVTLAGHRVSHIAHRAGQGGRVELWPTMTPQTLPETPVWDAPLDQQAPSSPRARLAVRIADTIAGWLSQGEILASRGRPIRPGDVMILVRQRDAFVDEMVRALKARQVPVAGADRMILAEQIAVMDLLALARFVLLPEDDLTLAEVLKSPLIGFGEEALFTLAHGRPGRLWAALESRRDESPLFARAHGELAACLARADFVPPFEFFAGVLEAGGGRKRLYARLGTEAADPIDEFLARALAFERTHPPSLQGFLHWIEAGGDKVKRDMEQRLDEVRVMTVHGAKGLEADIVFLPDTCSVPEGRHDAKILWQAGPAAAALPLWPVRRANDEALCQAARASARLLREEEYRRLLYVAMTRARDRLYICGFEGGRSRTAGCWYDLVSAGLESLAQEVTTPAGMVRRLDVPQTVPAPAAIAGPPEEAEAGRLPVFGLAPVEPAPPRPLAPSRPDEEEPPAASPLGPDRGRRFRRGRLIHRLLQTLPDLPEADRLAAAARFLAAPAHDLSPAAQGEIATETLALFADPEIAPLFGPSSRAEVPISGLVGTRILAGQVDRLVVTAARVLIVDYKSNRPPPASPDAVPAIYLRQMAAYRAALRRIYPDRAVEALLIWTDGPRLMPLAPALLDPWTLD